MIVIDGSILVSPYFETIVATLEPTQIVVPRLFRRDLLSKKPGLAFRTFMRFYEADEHNAWPNFDWAKSQLNDWVKVDDGEFAKLVGRAQELWHPWFEAFQKSNPDLEQPVAFLITDELVQARGLTAPIIAIGGPQSATWSVIENTFGEAGQCTVLDLSPEEKRERLQQLKLSLAAVAALDLCLIEVIAPLPLALESPLAPLSQCRFVLIDP